jgi:inosine-uridine nucleoside N-ribohydrolase
MLIFISPSIFVNRTEKIPIILDTDIGYYIEDDFALALALAMPEIDLKAVTIVNSFEAGEKHTKQILDSVNREDIPVAFGKIPTNQTEIEKINNFDWSKKSSNEAVELIHNITSKEKVTIVAIGPLTNIGEAITKYPEIKGNIKEIIYMGGAIYCGYDGNNNPEPEWNVILDVPNAKVVFESGIPLYIVPLDVTWDLILWKDKRDMLEKSNTRLTNTLMEFHKEFSSKSGEVNPIMFDPPAVICAADKDIFAYRNLHIDITDNGLTVINYNEPPNAYVALWAQKDKIIDVIVEGILKKR